MNRKKVKISIFVEQETWEKNIQRLNRMPGIRRDDLLNTWLSSILDSLEHQPPNKLSKEVYKFWANAFVPIEKKRVNVSFDKKTIARLDGLLKKKNVPRGLFLSRFMEGLEYPINSLEDHILEPFSEALSMDTPFYTDLFPSPTQSKRIKRKHHELVALLKNIPDDF